MRIYFIFICFTIFYKMGYGQSSDTLFQNTILNELTIVGSKSNSDIHQLPEIVGTNIYAAKKSALIVLENNHGNIVSNTMRQVVAKIPGLFIWENEGSGIQINLATRGLSPNRSWEFNVRQNGYDIAADPLGYPEAYYNPQLQSIQRIEIVRGHGALQYGAQIGGMINYIQKNGSQFNKPLQVESHQTLGSNSLFNAYQAIGGNAGKIQYYSFFDHRKGDGWRNNNQFRSNTASGSITFKISPKLELNTQLTRWASFSQQPGGLNDQQFKENPQQSFRARNWFGLDWFTGAISLDYKLSQLTRFNFKVFNIQGDRESIGFFPSAGILQEDLEDPTTGKFANRTIDIDRYRNFGTEARIIHQFDFGRFSHTISTGIRWFTGSTFRYRGGKGSEDSDADFKLVPGGVWNSEIHYTSQNAAWFAEDLINLTPRLMFIPGFRLEFIGATASGFGSRLNGNPTPLQNQDRIRTFLLSGIGLEYLLKNNSRVYLNTTQSYRPVQFADLTTPPTTDVIDPNLVDANGLNTDLGVRGKLSDKLIFDFSLFNLVYKNRVGTIKQQSESGSFYNFRTNVGSSRSLGIESFFEFSFQGNKKRSEGKDIRIFMSGTLMDARYKNFRVISVKDNQLSETNYRHKKVEYAPDHIIRTGLTIIQKNWSTTLQVSKTSSVFTDANNTIAPTGNAQNGLIPEYIVTDWSMVYQFPKGFSLRGGVNNLFDQKYFTRRASGYPGPGVMPGEGRTFFITLGYVMPGH